MENFYTINLPKKSKIGRSHATSSKLQDSRVSMFCRLSDSLDRCFEKKVVDFYSSILTQLKFLFSESHDDVIPSLFIQGYCADWTSIFKQVEVRWGKSHMICYVTPVEAALKQLLAAIRSASKNNMELIVVLLQVECFPRNSLLDNVIQMLVNNSTLKSYLLINSAIEYTTILDRITRVNFTYLNIQTLELTTPDQLLNDIFDTLLDGSALGDDQLQFAGDVLSRARYRYLYEDFSLSELRKSLLFALADYLCRCREETLKVLEEKLEKKTNTAVTNRSDYVKALNCLVLLKSESDRDIDAIEEFLEIHSQIQSDDQFISKYLGALRAPFSDWNKEKWSAVLRKIERQLAPSAEVTAELEKLHELLSKIQAEQENNEPKPVADHNSASGKKSQRAHAFLKNKTKLMQAQRNLPTDEEMKLINSFLSGFSEKFLIKMDDQFLVDIPPERLAYLETSNVRHMDEIMNPHVDIEAGYQLDVITLYHALVESSSQTVTVDLTDIFDKFAAFLTLPPASDKRGHGPSVQSRFFNALAQLEYVGVVAVSASEKTLRLTYLPIPTMTFQSAVEPTPL